MLNLRYKEISQVFRNRSFIIMHQLNNVEKKKNEEKSKKYLNSRIIEIRVVDKISHFFTEKNWKQP